MSENVAIIGASAKPHRYSYKAQEMLTDYGHQPFLIAARKQEIMGLQTYASVTEIEQSIETVTFYINPKLHQQQVDSIIALKPKRVIFNPGTESETLLNRYQSEGIDAFNACTLVLLRTDQF